MDVLMASSFISTSMNALILMSVQRDLIPVVMRDVSTLLVATSVSVHLDISLITALVGVWKISAVNTRGNQVDLDILIQKDQDFQIPMEDQLCQVQMVDLVILDQT